MRDFNHRLRTILGAIVFALASAAANVEISADEPVAKAPKFTAEQEQSRQAILQSARWKKAQQAFHQWLKVQTAYDGAQVKTLEQQLNSQIAAMDAQALSAFLTQMEGRLAVLLSPEVSAARTWAESLYTKEGQRKLWAKYGVVDPMKLSGQQLETALARFAQDRQESVDAAASFNRGREAEVASAVKTNQAQQRFVNQAEQRASLPSTPYAPRALQPRPQRYQAPYDPVHYSIGPWGGAWIGF